LFYNTHEFILKNKPRYFIIENVKGLLSDDKQNKDSEIGRTFQRWIDLLGGKSVNGNPVLFPHEEATPYHVYWQVLNAKDYGVPQNRERVFIIGIRDDVDNNFTFPKPFPLTKRLKDVLEKEVDEKYFLSSTALEYMEKPATGGYSDRKSMMNDADKDTAGCITANHSKGVPYNVMKVKSATKKGYETATEGDSINLERPDSETRRGRVGKGVAQTLDTGCNQGVLTKIEGWYDKENKEVEQDDIIQTGQTNMKGPRIYKTRIAPTLPAENPRVATVQIGAFRGRNPENSSDSTTGAPMEQRLELNQNGVSNTLTSVQKDNVVVYGNLKGGKWDKTHEQSGRVYDPNGIGATLHTMGGGNQHPKIIDKVVQLNPSKESGGQQPYQHNRVYADYGLMTTLDTDSSRKSIETNYRIRRLTVRECFRLMDFNESFSWPVSDSQAYKQAGNSIVVQCLVELIKKLNLD